MTELEVARIWLMLPGRGRANAVVYADASGAIHTIALTPPLSPVANPSFDVTPARLITGLITEYGLCHASEKSMQDIGLAPPPLTSRLASDIPS